MCDILNYNPVLFCYTQSLSYVRLFATPWTVAFQAPLSMGFSRQEYWSGLPFPSIWDLPSPRIEPRSLALQADSLSSEPPGKPRLGGFNNQEEMLCSHPRVEAVKVVKRGSVQDTLKILPTGFLVDCIGQREKRRIYESHSFISTKWKIISMFSKYFIS